ncbi:unnamed protein product [Fusarium graminearum]|uniref:Chromosome 4, complete genome n=1 Tax=Gibberella zeae (strain ATCC MYA-4620 / CBS 123657 / FGSC 9075 / NRRL 31084 / PH-1) TaxID=229533 RepID=I1S7W9_GIBZE|nr:hypothetical protein FGSG_12944 [Fusarium graminearum PH-1]ESU12712.1 hypothetical protein FGSG_12944 [Fusarium graminearum PH-1]CEF84111.1 unnamed protein product [Fusarium graminearum]CZS72259.1 unnamed protein product [Fusarium graminearum]|eukprot:XP_011326219.1 hypothetical protein FGSG_12944 [Fusarium graminearum PH-1]
MAGRTCEADSAVRLDALPTAAASMLAHCISCRQHSKRRWV